MGVGIGGVTVSPHPAHPSQKQKQKNNTSCLRPYNDDKDNTKIKNQKNKTKNKQNETGEDSGVARDMSARQGWCPEVGEGEVVAFTHPFLPLPPPPPTPAGSPSRTSGRTLL